MATTGCIRPSAIWFHGAVLRLLRPCLCHTQADPCGISSPLVNGDPMGPRCPLHCGPRRVSPRASLGDSLASQQPVAMPCMVVHAFCSHVANLPSLFAGCPFASFENALYGYFRKTSAGEEPTPPALGGVVVSGLMGRAEAWGAVVAIVLSLRGAASGHVRRSLGEPQHSFFAEFQMSSL